MITRLKQWLCQHDYTMETTTGLDNDLYFTYGIRREIPLAHADRCIKCNKTIPIVTKTYVYLGCQEKMPD